MRKEDESDLEWLAREPQYFDAQAYLDANPDVKKGFLDNRSEEGKRWSLTWGSMKSDGKEVGHALTHYIRNGNKEGRQAYFRETPDDSFTDMYGGEYLSDVPGDGRAGDALTQARMHDLGILDVDGRKLNLSYGQSDFGKANKDVWETAVGFYPESGHNPTLGTFQALPNVGKLRGFYDDPEGGKAFRDFVEEGISRYTDPTKVQDNTKSIQASAQNKANADRKRTSSDAVTLSLMGAKGVGFEGGGFDYTLPDSVQQFIARANLPDIVDPFEGIDPATGLTFDEIQARKQGSVATGTGMVSGALNHGNISDAAQAAAVGIPFTPGDFSNPLGIGDNHTNFAATGLGMGASLIGAPTGIGTLASLASQGYNANRNADLVTEVLQGAGLDASGISAFDDFMSQGITGAFGAGNSAGTQGGSVILDAMNGGVPKGSTSNGLMAAFNMLGDDDQIGALKALGVGPIPQSLFDDPVRTGVSGGYHVAPTTGGFNAALSSGIYGPNNFVNGTQGAPLRPITSMALPPPPAQTAPVSFK